MAPLAGLSVATFAVSNGEESGSRRSRGTARSFPSSRVASVAIDVRVRTYVRANVEIVPAIGALGSREWRSLARTTAIGVCTNLEIEKGVPCFETLHVVAVPIIRDRRPAVTSRAPSGLINQSAHSAVNRSSANVTDDGRDYDAMLARVTERRSANVSFERARRERSDVRRKRRFRHFSSKGRFRVSRR